jgi:stearoyl-CoA desaturase (delta-9 desaturase)
LIWAYAIPYASYLFVFAHVNYVTHGHDEQGRSIVRNRNSNLYYRLINAFCDGIYFHEDHHRFPRRYDPRLVG